jgi:threonine dehydrogenase-like Zn-dependent dehydrogenase
MRLENDRAFVLRQAMRAVRKGGVLSIPGVYSGFIDKVPFGAVFNKGVTLKMGQTHVQRYMAPLLRLVEDGKIDPSFVITHRVPLTQAPDAYEKFCNKDDGFIKVVLDPAA